MSHLTPLALIYFIFLKVILEMDIVLGGDESSSSKLSETPASMLTSTAVDEVSDESTKLSLPIPDSESVPTEESRKTGNFCRCFCLTLHIN